MLGLHHGPTVKLLCCTKNVWGGPTISSSRKLPPLTIIRVVNIWLRKEPATPGQNAEAPVQVVQHHVLDGTDGDEIQHGIEVEPRHSSSLILHHSFHSLFISLIKVTRWRSCVGNTMLSQPQPDTPIVQSEEVMIAWYDCCGRTWLRKHSAASTATPPDELDEAQHTAMKAVLKNQWTAQITVACLDFITVQR